jgi:hypothetical protein
MLLSVALLCCRVESWQQADDEAFRRFVKEVATAYPASSFLAPGSEWMPVVLGGAALDLSTKAQMRRDWPGLHELCASKAWPELPEELVPFLRHVHKQATMHEACRKVCPHGLQHCLCFHDAGPPHLVVATSLRTAIITVSHHAAVAMLLCFSR